MKTIEAQPDWKRMVSDPAIRRSGDPQKIGIFSKIHASTGRHKICIDVFKSLVHASTFNNQIKEK